MGVTSFPATIIKGPVHRRLDAQLNHTNEAGVFDQRASILAALKDSDQDYIEILKEPAIPGAR